MFIIFVEASQLPPSVPPNAYMQLEIPSIQAVPAFHPLDPRPDSTRNDASLVCWCIPVVTKSIRNMPTTEKKREAWTTMDNRFEATKTGITALMLDELFSIRSG